MGVYIYGARTPLNVKGIGQLVPFTYAYKPYWGWSSEDSNERMAARTLGPSQRYWDKVPTEQRPTLAAVFHVPDGQRRARPEAGIEVFRWDRTSVVWADCDKLPGEKVGYLKPLPGGRWEIVPTYDEATGSHDYQFFVTDPKGAMRIGDTEGTLVLRLTCGYERAHSAEVRAQAAAAARAKGVTGTWIEVRKNGDRKGAWAYGFPKEGE